MNWIELMTFCAGEPFYEAVRPIAAHTELIVFDLPGHRDEEELYLPAVRSLRTSLFRRTMGLILEGMQRCNVNAQCREKSILNC